MGTWGHGSFENDDALDWLTELSNVSQLDEAFDAVIDGGYVEASEGWVAIAAGEVVAALNGRGSDNLPNEALNWISGRPKPSASLLAKASQAVEQILVKGELQELWEESPENNAGWRASLNDLRQRLL